MNHKDIRELNKKGKQQELNAVKDYTPRISIAVKDRDIAGAQKTVIVFSNDDNMASVYTSTPRIQGKIDYLCKQIPNHYKLDTIRKNSKGQIASKNYLVSVAMIGLLTPTDSGVPDMNCGRLQATQGNIGFERR